MRCQGERTKFKSLVDPNWDLRIYIGIYESIVIEFFLRRKIHNKGTCVQRFNIRDLVFIVTMVNYETLAMQCHAENMHILRDPANVKITIDS